MNRRPAITILGTGALGSVLLDFFKAGRYTVHSSWRRKQGYILNPDTGQAEPSETVFPSEASHLGDLIFITTPDDQIMPVSEQLAAIPAAWNEKMVVHCSGNMLSDKLTALALKGAKTASTHPIQTFKRGDTRERLKNIYISYEGDSELTLYLKELIEEMDARAVELSPHQKHIVHIAAVMASNYLVALLNRTDKLLLEEGVNEGVNLLQPLVEQTVANIFNLGVDNALTGPVSRGDEATVREHLETLNGKEKPDILYRLLGGEALQVALSNGQITEEQAVRLRKLLG